MLLSGRDFDGYTIGLAGMSEGVGAGRTAAGSGGLATTHHSFLSSFSAGSTATIATKYSFFQVFRDLQNYLAKFSKILQNFAIFCKFCNFSKNQLDNLIDLEKPEKMRIWLLS